LGLNAIFVSIGLTVYSLKTSKRLLQVMATLAAMILGLINLGLYEATIGLEVVRWALVWVVLQQKSPADTTKTSSEKQIKLSSSSPIFQSTLYNLRQALKFLVPYLLMMAGFLFWRLFIFKSVRRATNIDVLLANYASNPLYSVVQIFIGYIKDLFETVVLAWFVPFYQFTAEGRFNIFLSALGVALVVLALAGAYVYLFSRLYPHAVTGFGARPQPISRSEDRDFLWIGLIGVVIPSAVIVLLGRNVIFSIQWDRYTTQSMLGVAIIISGLAFKLLRGTARWVALGTFIVLAVMTQYHSAASYSRFWDYQRGVIWQLSWRAPGLQPGTTLIVSLPDGTRLAEEYEIWGPVNMAYYPGQRMQISGQVPSDGLLLDLEAKTLDKRTVRNINIRRDYGKALVLSMPSQNSCVHVLDGQHLELPFFEDGRIQEIAGYSNIELIDLLAKPMTPSASIFGPEPEHNWCYYYQKIELALQSGSFDEAVKLADEAAQKRLKPSDETEWMPVIEAYANLGQAEKASQAVNEIDKSVRRFICFQQSPAAEWPQDYNAEFIRNTLCGSK
jgi:hypothetical protein